MFERGEPTMESMELKSFPMFARLERILIPSLETMAQSIFFQKWDQTPDFGLKSLILVSFYF